MDYWRQLDIVPIEKLKALHVNVVGAGGIGSPAALALAKMGVGALTLWDDDIVEEHNLPNQFHYAGTMGQDKVVSLRELVYDFVPMEDIDITDHKVRIKEDTKLEGIVAVGVDSMASRQAIWKAAKANEKVEYFVDGRMGGEMLRLYSLNPRNPVEQEQYEKTLYEDKDALHLPCTAQSIIYTGMLAGALIANSVKRYAADQIAAFEIIFDLNSYTFLSR